MKTLTEETFAHTLKDIMQEKFYHFNDLYDLLEKIYISDGEQMIGDNRTDDSWEKACLRFFNTF